jgi:hypothetical protein
MQIRRTKTLFTAQPLPRAHLQRALLILTATQVLAFLIVLGQTVMLTPFSDMVAWLDQYAAYKRDGGLLHYLFAPHNEHRLVTIRLLTICDVELFGGRGVAFIIAAICSLGGILALVWDELRRAGEQAFGPATAIAIALVLTVPNAMDCSIPINSLYPITVFFAFSSIILLTGRRPALASLAAVTASLSNAAGVVIWPVLLCLGRLARTTRLWIAIMGVVTLLICGAFAFNFGQPSTTAAHSIGEAILYWPSFVGLPWSRSIALQVPADVVGVALMAAAAACCVRLRTNDRLEAIAFAFALFSLGCSVLAAIGRSGMHEPFPPVRYTIFMMPVHLALLFFVLRRKWLSEPIAVALMTAMVAQQLLSGYAAVHTARSLGVPVGL